MINTLQLECNLNDDAVKPFNDLKQKISDIGKEDNEFNKPKLTFVAKWYAGAWKFKIDSVSEKTFGNSDVFTERLSRAGKDVFGESFKCIKDTMDLEQQGRNSIVRVTCNVFDKNFPFHEYNTLMFLDDTPPTMRTEAFKVDFNDMQDIVNNTKKFCKG